MTRALAESIGFLLVCAATLAFIAAALVALVEDRVYLGALFAVGAWALGLWMDKAATRAEAAARHLQAEAERLEEENRRQ